MPTLSIQQTFALAVEHHRAGRLREAEALYRQILAQQPRHAEALHLLGVMADQAGRHDIAVDLIRQAIAVNPKLPDVYNDLGISLRDLGQLDEAIAAYRQAVALNPDDVSAFNNLGNALYDKRQLVDAIAAYRRALELRPDLPEVHANFSVALKDNLQLDEALAAARRAIALKPDYAEAHNNLGNALKDDGQLDEALAAYRRAVTLNPRSAGAHSNLVLSMHYHPDFDASAIFQECRRWNRQHAEPLKKFIQPHRNDRRPGRRLKIGYVSPDFREHPVGRFLLPLLAHHNKDDFEIFAYAQAAVPDSTTARLRSCVDVWRNTLGLSDAQVADLVYQDQIDILVDLAMHTSGNRLLVFAGKPAPVQVTYLGYCSTTGLDTIDYRLSDPYLDPPGMDESVYSERTLRLPETYWCYQPSGGAVDVGPLPALSHGHVTFGCLNNFCKVGAATLAVWTKLLRAVPNSHLLLHAHPGAHRQKVHEFLQRQGIEAHRVRFAGRLPLPDYLRLHQQIDVGLDTIPFAGGTTTCDALWMGVPVVGLVGQTAVGRAGLSILSNLGLPELVARSEEEYLQIATRLANDLPGLAHLRGTLRARMEKSPLMDAPRFARNIEAAYRQMWHTWCASPPPTMEPHNAPALDLPQALAQAVAHHQAGRLNEAESRYRQILAQQPNHAEALHLLGLLAHQVGRHDSAVDLIRQALTINPNSAEACSNLGNALLAQGKVDEAIAAFRQAIAINPHNAEAYNNVGTALCEKGQYEDALAAFRRSIQLNPNFSQTHNNLGNVFKGKGQLAEAIAAYRQAVALDPRNHKALANLGDALLAHGQLDEAIVAFQASIALEPRAATAHYNLAYILQAKGQLDAAIAAYRQVIALKPDHARAYNNLGAALLSVGQLDEAVAACRQAIALRPDNAEALSNLSNALKDMGQLDEAIAACRQAVALRPNYAHVHSNLIFELHFHPGYDAPAIAEELRRWNRQIAEPLKKFIEPHRNDRDPTRRLRIGYVSPDFRNHVVAKFLLPLLVHRDKSRVEIFAYAHVPVPDQGTQTVRSQIDTWRDIVGLSDAQAADLIRQDRIDILVDLSLHSAHNRLLVFARKPAPVQVTYLAYCSSTGLDTVDYRLTDPYLDPPGMDESVYSERTFRLPQTYWCFAPSIDAIDVGGLPALQQGTITFGCLNNFCKISPPALAVWAKLLRALPGARLVVHAHQGSHRQRMLRQLEQQGIAPQRVRFVDRLTLEEYFRLYQQIDIALDPFPYNGGTTTCDALWMGVPVVSLAGRTAVGRTGASILSNVGLTELVAGSEEQYVQIAAALAGDLPRLRQLRATLRQRMQESALMDAPRFARDVEAAYRQMWQTWCVSSTAR